MNKHKSVPKLNLAPKLKRPLSLWNPLDYLRLLYWVFFFPQAIQWYLDNFGGKRTLARTEGKSDRYKSSRHNLVAYKLYVQGLLIIFFLLLIPTYQLGVVNFSNIDKSTSIAEQNQPNQQTVKQEKTVFDTKYSFDEQNSYLYYQFIRKPELREKLSFSEKVATAYSSSLNSEQWWVYGLFFSLWIIAHIGVLKPWKGVSFGLTFTIVLGLQLCIFLWIGYLIRLGQTKESYFSHTIYISKALFEASNTVSFALFLGIVAGIMSSIHDSLNRKVELEILTLLIIFLPFIILDFFTKSLFTLMLLLPFYSLSLRLESWLISCLFNRQTLSNTNQLGSHVTPLPLPYISYHLKNWLEQDWETGIYNANQLVKYTLQFIPVSKTIDKTLATVADAHLIYRVNQLAANPYDWKLVHFASAPLNRKVRALSKNIRIDTPARATAAGFWYLHEKQPAKAAEAFERVRSLLYGEEVYTLAKTLAVFQPATELNQIAGLNVPVSPQDNLLRPDTWQVLSSLVQVVEDIKSIQHSVSRTAKAFALNRAIGELTGIINTPNILPEAERELIVEIAQNWKQALERIARDIGNITVTKPVVNPYVIGDPVQGSLFAGREDIMRQLAELWSGDRLQSVVLYGHRRMGKTSILLNISDHLNSNIKLAYINLLRLGDCSQGVGEVLMQICDGIAEVTGVEPPDDHALLKLPYRTFERYIKEVETNNNSLIIAIDEFEKIEELIARKHIPTDFLGFLRGIVQMNPKIALVFAGLHTLEEMTGDYFQPFFASIIPLRVGFLSLGATRQILANPNSVESLNTTESEEFILDYTPQALEFIYHLTAGQPYLIQLIGFQLVRHYNQQMFEEGIVRNPLFSAEDVQIVINQKFFQQGRYYFEGIWGQAARDIVEQQEIIKALAPYPQGLSESDLIAQDKLKPDIFYQAIATLSRHDVVMPTDKGWKIIVELFRQWVLNQ